jgi:hypothetical protein
LNSYDFSNSPNFPNSLGLGLGLLDLGLPDLGLVVLNVVKRVPQSYCSCFFLRVLYSIMPSLTLARVNSSGSVPVPVDIFVNFVHFVDFVDHGRQDGHCPPARRRPQSCH